MKCVIKADEGYIKGHGSYISLTNDLWKARIYDNTGYAENSIKLNACNFLELNLHNISIVEVEIYEKGTVDDTISQYFGDKK